MIEIYGNRNESKVFDPKYYIEETIRKKKVL